MNRKSWQNRDMLKCLRSVPVGLLLGVLGVTSGCDVVWSPFLQTRDLTCGNGVFCTQTSPVTTTLRAIWGADAQHIFAVGDNAVILHYDGTSWANRAPNGIGGRTLRSVWGCSASEVWVVGDAGVILKWDGSNWKTSASGSTKDLYGVWCGSSTKVWAVGAVGTILKFDGTSWLTETTTPSTTQTFHKVWGSQTSLWTVGEAGKIYSNSNYVGWVEETSGTTKSLFAIGGFDANSLYAVGSDAVIVKRGQGSPASWAGENSGVLNASSLQGVWGGSAQRIWVVGLLGVMGHWNGSMWTLRDAGVTAGLYGVWGSDPSHVWIVGEGGTILYREE